ncbi:MAG: T9SS type A sorting domain-containing protein [Prevotellaceae bacterium]|jgi:hypothetical protein|nr:T9SS type A sorting domain-containing protein [Prevotellaceae bacterium]
MIKKYFKKALGLMALLCCGVWSTNAQLSVSGGGANGCHCMGTSGTFTVSYTGSDGYVIESTSWTKIGGGVDITAGHNSTTVSVATQTDTVYNSKYSRFAPAKLNVFCRLKKDTTIDVTDCKTGVVTKHKISSFKEVDMDVKICKSFTYPYEGLQNKIVGPECVALGEQVTYSIKPWVSMKDANLIGFDSYGWNLDTKEDYYSSDESSITFTVNADFLKHKTLAVSMGACNGNDSIKRTLGIKPAKPIISMEGIVIDWEDGLCLSPGEGSKTITIDNADLGNSEVTYIWDEATLNGWMYSTTPNTLTFTPTNARTIKLTVKSACEDETYSLKINSAFASSNTITNNAKNPNCLPAGQSFRFKVDGAANGTPMTWALESGSDWSFEDSPTIAEPMIRVGSRPCRITVTDDCSNSIFADFSISPNTPEINESNQCIDAKDNTTPITFTVTPDDNATGYQWEFPAEWSSNAINNTTEDPTITITTDGTTSGQIKVRALGCIDSDLSTAVDVNIAPETPKAIINTKGCINYNIADQVIFSVQDADPDKYTYSWIIPDEFGTPVGSPDGTDGTITVDTKGVSGTIKVQVDAKGACDPSPWKEEPITIDANGFGLLYNTDLISVPAYRLIKNNSIPATFNYRLFNNGNIVTNGVAPYPFDQENLMLNLPGMGDIAGSSIYTLVVDVYTSDCDYRLIVGAPIEDIDGNSSRIAKSMFSDDEESLMTLHSAKTEFASIYPNPAKNSLNIEILEAVNYPANIYVMDTKGSLVSQTTTNTVNTQIDSSSWVTGSYIVLIVAGNQTYRQVIIKN